MGHLNERSPAINNVPGDKDEKNHKAGEGERMMGVGGGVLLRYGGKRRNLKSPVVRDGLQLRQGRKTTQKKGEEGPGVHFAGC